MDKLSIGLSVTVKGKRGTIRFIGKTQFAPGNWVGVELLEPTGKNNGTINDIEYFKCSRPGLYGIFVSPGLVVVGRPVTPRAMASQGGGNTNNNTVDNVVDNPTTSSPSKIRHDDKEQRLQSIIERLQFKLQDALKDVKQYQAKLQHLDDLESRLESVTIDRDYFKTENSKLHHDLEALNLKYSNLAAEFDIIKQELELNKEIENELDLDIDANNDKSILVNKLKSLELKVIELKNFNESNELKFTNEIINLTENSVSKHDYHALKLKLSNAEETITNLKLQIDSIDDLDNIINHLTAENDELNLKISRLTSQLDELNELQQLDNDLQENHSQIEKELNNTIINLTKKLNLETAKVKSLDDRLSSIDINSQTSDTTDKSINQEEFTKLNKIIENLKLELTSKTRDYNYLNFLVKISKMQLLSIDNNNLKLKFNLISLHEIINYIKSFSPNIIPYLYFIHDISQDSSEIVDDFINDLENIIITLYDHIQNQTIYDFKINQITELSKFIFKNLKSNSNYNKCCIHLIKLNVEIFKPDITDLILEKIKLLNFEYEVNKRFTIDITFENINFPHYLSELDMSFTKSESVTLSHDFNQELNNKEKLIKDLELTIQLMQNNLNNLNDNHTLKLQALNNQLTEINQSYLHLKNDYTDLTKNNNELKLQINNLLNSGKFFHLSYIKGKFNSKSDEVEFIEKIGLIEEISYLRKMISIHQVKVTDDLSWLEIGTITNNDHLVDHKLSKLSLHLRKISNSSKLLKVSQGYQKKLENPKFVVPSINQQYYQYIKQRNDILT